MSIRIASFFPLVMDRVLHGFFNVTFLFLVLVASASGIHLSGSRIFAPTERA